VDHEGFPRNDIDFGELANYRSLKRRTAELNNDHYALMKEIEIKLFALHATLKPTT
jgi:DNA-binding ferritin-like protein (Dps family)